MNNIMSASFCIFAQLTCLQANEAFAQNIDEQLAIAQQAQSRGEYQLAIEQYQLLSDKGIDIAQFSLGFLYENGLGTPKSSSQACLYYQKAALQKVPLALEKVGDCYLQGILSTNRVDSNDDAKPLAHAKTGLSPSQIVALEFYLQANQSGIFSAACKAGEVLLQYGNEDEQMLAMRYCEEAVSKGSISAAYTMGTWFLQNPKIKTDLAKAQAYLEMAKPQQEPAAAFALAQVYDVYSQYDDNSQNYAKLALYWYETAASSGFSEAYLPTSLLYWKLSEQDNEADFLAKSYLWISAANAFDPSLREREDVKKYTLAVDSAVPEDWKSTLDTTVQQHLQQFH